MLDHPDRLLRILIKILVILRKTLITNYYKLILLLMNLRAKSTKMDMSFLLDKIENQN